MAAVHGPDATAGRATSPGSPGPPGTRGVVARPGLFERLGASARVTVVSAPAGSGKTLLLRSWFAAADLSDRAAWVQVGHEERNPQRFWLSVADALRQTTPGAALVRALTAAPELDGWAIVERLLKDLAPLEDRTWLVLDDVHELDSAETRRQLELLLMRAPPDLRFAVITRHDLRLGLHRVRLEGELTEIRAADLEFSVAETRELFEAAGVELPESTVAVLHERTEGWAAGLRLAALSLAGHPDPDRFTEDFSGTERTVAEYLMAEVLERQSDHVRRLLLRTSILRRVSGELADALTGGRDGEWVLRQLEEANAFVVALDARRSWFRYHHLFADLLHQELRRSAPDEVTALHQSAATWFAEHGHPVEAIWHAQSTQDWALATRLLADNWPALRLGGQTATVHGFLVRFPAQARAADPELAALVAADELTQGGFEEAKRFLALAERGAASVPASRRGRLQVLLGIVQLLLARQRGDLQAVVEAAERVQALAEAPDTAEFGLGEDLRGLALLNLGSTEFWANRLPEAERHLEQGVALARRIERPFLECSGLAHLAGVEIFRSFARSEERSRQAIELAREHGWTDGLAAGIAYTMLANVLAWQGRSEEAEPWIQRAERSVRAEAEPAAAIAVHYARGRVELVRGRNDTGLAAFRVAERLDALLANSHLLATRTRAFVLLALVGLGDIERAEQTLAGLGEQDRVSGEVRIATAGLRLAQHDPGAAAAVLAPVLDGAAPVAWSAWLIEAFLLEAIARDALGDTAASGEALERALDAAETDLMLFPFLIHPARDLLERHAQDRTKHAALIAEILDALAGNRPASPAVAPPLLGPLTDTEIRVLRYLPTNLSAREIADELYVSANTVKTHIRNVYVKLGTHKRTGAVERARALGLLAPSGRRR
jgi:LuxR family transcriptional regulator, maltose regulon positive regulatory protein